MYELAIALGFLLFLRAAIYKHEWGIYLIILGLPSYQIRFQIFGIPATFLEGMILILAAVQLVAIIKNRQLLSKIKLFSLDNLFILLFLLAAGISIFVAPDTAKAAGIFKAYFFEAVLFYFLVRAITDSKDKREKLFQSLALLAAYLSIFGLYQFLTLSRLPASWWGVEIATRRIISLLNHPNGLALVLGPILAMLIIRQPKTKLAWAAIAFGLPAFYLTLSRAGWLSLVIVIAGVSLFGEHRKKIIAAAAAAGVLVMLIPFSRGEVLELLQPADPSKENRYVLWSAAADILKKHPITGVGLTGFRESYKAYPLGPDRVVQNYPHNFFLTFWTETGLLGLLSIIGLLILFTKKIYKII